MLDDCPMLKFAMNQFEYVTNSELEKFR